MRVIVALQTMVVRLGMLALVLMLSSRAYAAERATDWKAEGDQAFDARHFEQALALYNKAYAAEKNPSVAFNLARTHEALGQYASALDYFEAFKRDATSELRAKVPNIEALIARMGAHVATVTIHCNEANAEVRIRGESVGKTPFANPLRANAGRAVVEIVLPKFHPFTRTLQLPEGGAVLLDAMLVPVTATAPPPEIAVPMTVTPKPADSRLVSKWWFWTAIGVVAVGGGVTIYALSNERAGDQGSLGSLRAGGAFLHF